MVAPRFSSLLINDVMALEDIPADSGVIVSNIVLSLQGILLKDPFLIFIVFYYIIKDFLTLVKATTRSYFRQAIFSILHYTHSIVSKKWFLSILFKKIGFILLIFLLFYTILFHFSAIQRESIEFLRKILYSLSYALFFY